MSQTILNRLMKKLAIAFLAVAITAIAFSFWFSQHEVNIQGPSAVAVLADNSVWLSVDEELWQLSADGHLLAKKSSQQLGISGAVGNIANHPSGMLILGIRNQDALHFFNPASGKIERSLLPQWPASLKEHSSRAINYAFSDNGLLAIATGGGHAVALFDESGHFLRRTAPGLYRFTNGLWWEQDTLWSTNTNQFELIALSPNTMQAKKKLALNSYANARFLGMAVASRSTTPHQSPSTGSTEKPFATVVRFANNMIAGRVVDVFPDGEEREFKGPLQMEPRALAWQAEKLLVVDGKSLSVKQFNGDGALIGDFGDSEMRAELATLGQSKAHFKLAYRVCLFIAIALFGIGFFLAVLDARREQTAKNARKVNPKELGMPVLDTAQLWLKLIVFTPILLLILLAILIKSLPIKLALYLAILVCLRVTLVWASRRKEWEPILNMQALRDLTRPDFASLLEPGETVRETLTLVGFQRSWVVLTQRRTLIFSSNALDRRLKLAIDNADITTASLTTWRELTWLEKLRTILLMGNAKLDVRSADKVILSGYVLSLTTAERIVSLMSIYLGQSSSQAGTNKKEIANTTTNNNRPMNKRLWQKQILASAIVPGLGQWMQGRRGTALLFFLIFAIYMLAATIPLVWTIWGSRAEVSMTAMAIGILTPPIIAAIAAWDCWNMRGD